LAFRNNKQMTNTVFNIGNIAIGGRNSLFVIAGPCVIESQKLCLEIAEALKEISEKTSLSIIFKASFDKANRSSISSFRGLGLDKGLEILDKVRSVTGLAVLTDVHEPAQAKIVADVVDCIQVPAFLCRQTNLLIACARTNKPVNVKKGQFLSPQEMENVVEKIRDYGNNKILLTERGTFFGYNRLVNDMTAIKIMQGFDCPVVFDATHSTQQPGGLGKASGGSHEMTPILAKAAVAAGADGLFIETHPDPPKAKSDASTMIPISWVEQLLIDCKKIFEVVHGN
jgi:2-dehydro-3-deoxyphosphooctonate aldolase (KDO 8-P synthase)